MTCPGGPVAPVKQIQAQVFLNVITFAKLHFIHKLLIWCITDTTVPLAPGCPGFPGIPIGK